MAFPGRDAEVVACRGIDAEDARAPFGEVQIDLQNPGLRPQRLDGYGEAGLQQLAGKTPAVPEEQILRRLLTDGAGPTQASALPVLVHGLLHGLPVESAVQGKALVLGRDHGQRHMHREFVHRLPVPAQGWRDRAGSLAEHVHGVRRVHPAQEQNQEQRQSQQQCQGEGCGAQHPPEQRPARGAWPAGAS
jgi:hypothetical protein